MLVGLVLTFGGVLLIRGAMRNQHPWSPIVEAFGGAPLDPPGSKASAALAGASGFAQVGEQVAGALVDAATRSKVISTAMSYLGDTYRLGGTGTDGTIDCSGLVMRAWGAVGVPLPHYTMAIRGVCDVLNPADVKAGDIIGYWKLDGALFDHVALYIDGPLASPAGRMIESTPHDGGVAIVGTDHQGVPSGFYRPKAA